MYNHYQLSRYVTYVALGLEHKLLTHQGRMPIDYPTIGLAGEVSCLKVLLPRDESKGVFFRKVPYVITKKEKKRREYVLLMQ